jgi:hypothetical protein
VKSALKGVTKATPDPVKMFFIRFIFWLNIRSKLLKSM